MKLLLLIADIIKDGYRHPDHVISADAIHIAHCVPHKHGLTEYDMDKAFESAGLSLMQKR
ncbi:hypothetical protein L208DRAFT_1403498 [Tricholoma matsutake]|nr:hypothetical protein L208DRAFT_1403498 [Tricholoma matsutake 945]